MLIQTIIDQAASSLYDPAKGRIPPDQWLMFANDALEEITGDYKVLEQDWSFDLLVNEDRYLYPSNMVVFTRLRYSPTPTDNTTFREIHEAFEDEIRRRVDWGLPQGDSGFKYWARANFLQLTPRPTTFVSQGGLLSGYRLANWVDNPTGLDFELPATLRKITRDRMVISAKRALERYDEANADEQLWQARLSRIADKIEDRSDDKRPRLRPRTAQRPYSRMT